MGWDSGPGGRDGGAYSNADYTQAVCSSMKSLSTTGSQGYRRHRAGDDGKENIGDETRSDMTWRQGL